jgi:hypothetical protein
MKYTLALACIAILGVEAVRMTEDDTKSLAAEPKIGTAIKETEEPIGQIETLSEGLTEDDENKTLAECWGGYGCGCGLGCGYRRRCGYGCGGCGWRRGCGGCWAEMEPEMTDD